MRNFDEPPVKETDYEKFRLASFDAQIGECQTMIREQCLRIARQVDSGILPGVSNRVLYCLQRTLTALQQARSLALSELRAKEFRVETRRVSMGDNNGGRLTSGGYYGDSRTLRQSHVRPMHRRIDAS